MSGVLTLIGPRVQPTSSELSTSARRTLTHFCCNQKYSGATQDKITFEEYRRGRWRDHCEAVPLLHMNLHSQRLVTARWTILPLLLVGLAGSGCGDGNAPGDDNFNPGTNTGGAGSQTGGASTGGSSDTATGSVGNTGGSENQAGSGGTGTGGSSAATGGTGTGGDDAGTGGGSNMPATASKHRIINTTDLGADPDDEQSMVRQLVSANDFDIEGLIVATGCWKKGQSSTAMLDKLVDAYGQVVDNLSVHSDEFPTHEYLKSISVMGQKGYGMGDVGAGKDSPGSELIIAAVDKDDPRPVWATCWGGCNTIAQAIWKVRDTRTAPELEEFLSKLRVFDILGQDNAGTWIAKTFPQLLYIRATGVYGWAPSDQWIDENVQNHGPLGAVYPNRKYATEGDTPAFMHVFANGLNDPDEVTQGSWGGRFESTRKTGIRGMSCMSGEDQAYDPYTMHGNTGEGSGAIKRWSTAYNNDFEARMDWSIKSNYADANHHPIAVVNGDTTKNVLKVTAAAGSSVELSSVGSSDPDGDTLTYDWFFYDEASSHNGSVTIQGDSSASATVQVPSGATGKELHIILELHDNGSPNLYSYRRVVISVQ